jgi:hypothetical protein
MTVFPLAASAGSTKGCPDREDDPSRGSWPEGLQPGQGDPVILELDSVEANLARLKELGYEVFTSIDSLHSHVRRRNEEAVGPVR